MKIEIMDLLHKIYNLDDMPGKIIFDNCVWRYCSEFQDYQSERGYLFGDYMSHINETVKFLNAEAEIIEEEKELEKLDIESENGRYRLKFNSCSYSLNEINYIILSKLNEVIDAIESR